jgi:hypothetical protein
MNHKRLTAPDNKLVYTGDSVRSDLGIIVPEECQKLGYKDIERPVEAVGVEHLCTVLTDLLQGPEASLARGVVITV